MPRQTCRLCAAIALLLVGATAVRADVAPPYGQPRPWGEQRGQLPPQPLTICAKVRIRSVDGAHLDRHDASGTLSAHGTASTAGWRDAELRLVTVDHPDEPGATAIFELVACPPEVGAEILTPLTASIPLTLPTARLRRIIVKAETNEQTLDLNALPPHQ